MDVQKRTGNFDDDPAFGASQGGLGFNIVEPVYFSYQITGGNGLCNHMSNEPDLYSITARADLDADGTAGIATLAAGTSLSGDFTRAGAVAWQNETE